MPKVSLHPAVNPVYEIDTDNEAVVIAVNERVTSLIRLEIEEMESDIARITARAHYSKRYVQETRDALAFLRAYLEGRKTKCPNIAASNAVLRVTLAM